MGSASSLRPTATTETQLDSQSSTTNAPTAYAPVERSMLKRGAISSPGCFYRATTSMAMVLSRRTSLATRCECYRCHDEDMYRVRSTKSYRCHVLHTLRSCAFHESIFAIGSSSHLDARPQLAAVGAAHCPSRVTTRAADSAVVPAGSAVPFPACDYAESECPAHGFKIVYEGDCGICDCTCGNRCRNTDLRRQQRFAARAGESKF